MYIHIKSKKKIITTNFFLRKLTSLEFYSGKQRIIYKQPKSDVRSRRRNMIKQTGLQAKGFHVPSSCFQQRRIMLVTASERHTW